MAKKYIQFKEKAINYIEANFSDAKDIIENIDDNKVSFAVDNGFSVEAFVGEILF